MIVLGIETSCDETGVAIYDTGQGILAESLYTQMDMHAEYGGVVPELASRDHVRKLLPMIDYCLKKANLETTDIEGVAYTSGPGLVGALLVGATIGHTLAKMWGVPALGVHHMEGHLLASMLEDNPPSYPFIALLVSGGHTQLVAVDSPGCYRLLGDTLDDAAGEAFDKTAKMLGLPYPGGPSVAACATHGDISRFRFPRPMTDRPGLDFSFSGLKTFTLNTINQHKDESGVLDEQTRSDICAAFQEASVQTLLIKCRRALEQEKMKTLVLAGGVAANQRLRELLSQSLSQKGINVFYPRLKFCTDNGAMIAYAGGLRLAQGECSQDITVTPRVPLSSLAAISTPLR